MGETIAPRLEACYFGADDVWRRMADVLEHTATVHCPSWTRSIRAITPEPRPSVLAVESHEVNTQKLEHWLARVEDAPDGTPMLLIDVDTAILRPLDPVWRESFDVAFTTKRRPFPFNLGVIFLRVSDRTRAFMGSWLEENNNLLTDRMHSHLWRNSFGGVNQAAFGRLLQRSGLSVTFHRLPCAEWNCEESAWPTFDSNKARVLHLKGSLRQCVFRYSKVPGRRASIPGELQPLVTLWQDLEREALGARSKAS